MKPRDYCDANGLTTSAFVQMMREHYPKYSNAANSLCNHTEQTGVCLSSAAQSVLKAPRREKRTKPNKFTFRLDDVDAWRFRGYLDMTGFTAQEVAEKAIKAFLNTWKL